MRRRVFVTNQTKLADIAGITPEHLSAVKGGINEPSDTLTVALEAITGINRLTWRSHNRRLILKEELKSFFASEKEAEIKFNKSRRIQK